MSLLTQTANYDEPGSWGRMSEGWPEVTGDVAYEMYEFANKSKSVPYGSYVLVEQRSSYGASKSRLRVHPDHIETLRSDFLFSLQSMAEEMRLPSPIISPCPERDVVHPAAQGMPDALSGKYGDVLLPFVALMEKELHANAGKGDRPGWLQMDRKTAMLEIHYHVAKLQKAAKDNDQDGIREYAADVANMAMMLVDVCGLLAAKGKAND